MASQQLQEVIEYLNQLKEDQDSNKRFKEKTEVVLNLLSSGEEMAVEKALLALEELSSTELPSYHRTQIWDVISMLECAKTN